MRQSPKGDLTATDVRAMAMRYLARRDYSRHELATKLRERGAKADLAREVVQALADDGLVSDARFAEIFCRHRAGQLYGPVRIRAELRHKGVGDDLVEAVLSDYVGQWGESALAWARKRCRGDLSRKEKARLYRSGRTRGFTHGQIMAAIDALRA